MTTRLPPYETAIFVKAPCSHRAWNASVSRWAWPLLIRSLATAASLNEGFPEIRHRYLRIALPVAIACQLFIGFTQCPRNLQNKWRGLELSRVAVGKRHKNWHITAGSDNVRFRRDGDANISNSALRQLWRRTPAAESTGDKCKSYVIRDCVRKRMTVLFLYLIGITIVYLIWASTSIAVEVQWEADYRVCGL